jgi:hypothetical protein
MLNASAYNRERERLGGEPREELCIAKDFESTNQLLCEVHLSTRGSNIIRN